MNQFKIEKTKANEYNLLDDAIQQILLENYFEALSYLQNCEEYLENSHKNISPYVALTVSHNTAFCFYRLGRIGQALDYLDTSLHTAKSILGKNTTALENLRPLRYLSTLHLQICAILSQNKQHDKALKYAQGSLKYIKEMLLSLSLLVSQYSFAHKKGVSASKMMDSVSKIVEVLDKVISKNFSKKANIYTGEDWINSYNIGNVMILQPILLNEWVNPASIKQELTFAKILENICRMASSYFSVAVELRFITQDRSGISESANSKDWHERALAICKCFLPNTSPLLLHVAKSYKKHYARAKKVDTKTPSMTKEKIVIKRSAEKPRVCSVKPKRKIAKPSKSTTPVRKLTPSKKKSTKKLLASTEKISTKDLLSFKSIKNPSDTGKLSSGRSIPTMKTEKYIKPQISSSESEKCNI